MQKLMVTTFACLIVFTQISCRSFEYLYVHQGVNEEQRGLFQTAAPVRIRVQTNSEHKQFNQQELMTSTYSGNTQGGGPQVLSVHLMVMPVEPDEKMCTVTISHPSLTGRAPSEVEFCSLALGDTVRVTASTKNIFFRLDDSQKTQTGLPVFEIEVTHLRPKLPGFFEGWLSNPPKDWTVVARTSLVFTVDPLEKI